MMALAERMGRRIQKQDEAAVKPFGGKVVVRQVLKDKRKFRHQLDFCCKENITKLETSSGIGITNLSLHKTEALKAYGESKDSRILKKRTKSQVGDYAYFKSVPTQQKNLDPSTKVGGQELEGNWCEIHVQVPIQWDGHVIRPYGGLKIVGDAIGTPIA
ncbi:hypothetical protein Vadar_031681 [Vaccinium darrowii]|uniref:Uncharacterized protein n=1 Tax=Vaccinium darrowii TaxID=229202 RepID=A0ACB7XDG4_9ERIC|nr:hypothetical protein Vadar_031681 [Vaccinium darrowii]